MATLKDIAKLANVSTAAVSRILNGDETLSVAPQTRQRVFDAARTLKYEKKRTILDSSFYVNGEMEYNRTTKEGVSSNPKRPAFCLGIVQWFSAKEELEDSYYLMVRRGIEDFCEKNGLTIVRFFKNDPNYREQLQNVDGIICIGKFGKKEVKSFTSITSNIVFLDMPVDEYQLTSLTMDFEHAVTQALDYLSNLGHTKIAYIGGKEYVGEHELVIDERARTYRTYMENRGIFQEELMIEGSFSTGSGFERMKELLELECRPTAVFAASDALAFGAMRAIQEAGLKVPGDISVIGFNDTEMSAYSSPPLTTIHAPAYDMGQHGANLLYVSSNLSIQTPLKIRIPCSLVERDSCGACRGEK